MYGAYLIIPALLLFASVSAQPLERMFLEPLVLRYAREPGVNRAEYYGYQAGWFGGLRLGYTLRPRLGLLAGVRRLPAYINNGPGEEVEDASQKGMEWNASAEWSLLPVRRRLAVLGELGQFYQQAKEEGVYWIDYGPYLLIGHRTRYYGLYPSLKLGCRVTDRLTVLTAARLRIGYFRSEALTPGTPVHLAYRERSGSQWVWESLAGLSLRIRL